MNVWDIHTQYSEKFMLSFINERKQLNQEDRNITINLRVKGKKSEDKSKKQNVIKNSN